MLENITFEKDLAPGVHVRIENVPAIVRGTGVTRRHYLDRATGRRVELLLGLARQRMRTGETDIRMSYADELQSAPKKQPERS